MNSSHTHLYEGRVGIPGENSSDSWALPPLDFAVLNDRFKFTIDVAASQDNAKLQRYYTRDRSGLAASWEGERVYCNPPYSDIRPWVEKANLETKACLIVFLVPANRTEQGWWQDLIEPYRDKPGTRIRCEFIRGRVCFARTGHQDVKPYERPTFGCCLLLWDCK